MSMCFQKQLLGLQKNTPFQEKVINICIYRADENYSLKTLFLTAMRREAKVKTELKKRHAIGGS